MQNSVTEVRVEPCTADRQSGRVRVGPRRPSENGAQLRIRKSGDRVEAIIVTCACGEETTILCDYPAKVSD